MVAPVVIGTLEKIPKDGKGIGKVGNKGIIGDYPDNSIIKIDQNTVKSPGDLRKFVDPNTPVRN